MKIHDSYRMIVAVADSDLIGKTFEEGIRQIEVRENFFKDKDIECDELSKILKEMDKEDATFNIVGEESVKCAIESGIVSKEGVMKIEGVPVALGLF